MIDEFQGRVAFQQRVIPSYRAPFLELLAKSCKGGFSVFAGMPSPYEGIDPVTTLENAIFVLGKNVHLFRISSSFYINWQVGLVKWLADYDPDILVLEANARYLNSRRAIQWMKKKGKKVIGWGLGAPAIEGVTSGLRINQRIRFLNRFDAIIAYSERGAKEYQSLGIKQEKIFVAYNAVTMPPEFPCPKRPLKVDGRLKLLFVGRLQRRKKLDLLFHACASLPPNIQPMITVVGDGPARSYFEKIAAEVYPVTKFVGSVHGKALVPYYLNADLFVLPGTGGLAIQQAMSYGLPVIVAKGDGTQDDLVIQGKNGWQVPENDEQLLREHLAAALTDLPRLRRMGEESYTIVKEKVNIQKMAERFLAAMNYVSGL